MRPQHAELTLKVGAVPAALWEDGDIINAWTPRRISFVHAEHCCQVKKLSGYARNRKALRPLDSLPFVLDQAICHYAFRRQGNSVIRTDSQGNEVSIGPRPQLIDGMMQHIDVGQFLARRQKHPLHRIYGERGAERWFGGARTVDDTALDTIWDQVNSQTGQREQDFPDAPLGVLESQHHLRIRTEPFDEAQAELYTAETRTDDEARTLLVRRSYRLAWDVDLYPSPADKQAIQNRRVRFDRRRDNTFALSHVIAKGGQ